MSIGNSQSTLQKCKTIERNLDKRFIEVVDDHQLDDRTMVSIFTQIK